MATAAISDNRPLPANPAKGECLIGVSGVSLTIRGNAVLQNVSITVARGQILTLIGPNGAGKSTLLRVILGLLQPEGGQIWLKPDIRVGYMPQHLVVEDTLPLTAGRFVTLGMRAARAKVAGVLAEVGAEHLTDRPLQVISGGERQRVMLARALLRQPDLLVLDEPAQGVDVIGQSELYGLIDRIRKRYGCGVLLVSHDLHLVMATTDQVICLNHHICCAGHPDLVSRHPAYLSLFGKESGKNLALYQHHHDHHHDLHGDVTLASARTPSDG